jgi:hypothetical protein
MATTKQVKSARSRMQKAQPTAKSQRAIPHQSPSAKSAVPRQPAKSAAPRQAAAIASRKRSSSSLKTRAELYELAKKRDVPGRSRMGRDELAIKLGVR